MEEVYKEILLDDGNEMRLQISNAYCGRSIRIEKDYIENDTIINGFTLCQWDDYAFDVFLGNFDFSKESVKFIVEINDPLFFCFHKLLEGIEELVIDSDEYEENMRMLFIRRNAENNIELEFRSKCSKKISEKYSVFIKNIGFDLRSKIDYYGLDTKKRLFDFFENAKNVLLEENHQITIDEYLLMRKLNKNNK